MFSSCNRLTCRVKHRYKYFGIYICGVKEYSVGKYLHIERISIPMARNEIQTLKKKLSSQRMKSNAVVRFSRVADTYRAVKIPPLCQLKDIYVLLQCTSVIFPYVRAERYREQSTAPLFLSLSISHPPSLSLYIHVAPSSTDSYFSIRLPCPCGLRRPCHPSIDRHVACFGAPIL